MSAGKVLTQRSREAEGGTRSVVSLTSAASAIPPLRFKGFTGAWEESRFSEFATVRRGLTYSPMDCAVDGVRVLRSSNIEEDKFVLHSDDVVVNKSAAGIEPVKNGDILITAANGSSQLVGKHALVEGVADGAAVHGGFMLLASSSESGFLNAAMSAPWYRDFIATKMMGGNGALGNLGRDAFEELKFTVPQDRKERGEIGAAFREIDALIAAREEALGKLEQFKKAMLEKMFPRMDVSHGGTETRRCRVPELRFKGFEGEWEEKDFDSFAKIRRGLTYSPSDCARSGVRVLRSSNIDEDKFAFYEDDVFVIPDAVNIPFVRGGDILVTAANGSSNLVGKHALIPDDCDGCVHGGFMHLISSGEYEFLNAWMSTVWYRRFVATSMMGGNGALGNLPASAFDELKLLVPASVDEQRKIGAYFRSLDALLSARREEIGKLKDLKKALLERMFV